MKCETSHVLRRRLELEPALQVVFDLGSFNPLRVIIALVPSAKEIGVVPAPWMSRLSTWIHGDSAVDGGKIDDLAPRWGPSRRRERFVGCKRGLKRGIGISTDGNVRPIEDQVQRLDAAERVLDLVPVELSPLPASGTSPEVLLQRFDGVAQGIGENGLPTQAPGRKH